MGEVIMKKYLWVLCFSFCYMGDFAKGIPRFGVFHCAMCTIISKVPHSCVRFEYHIAQVALSAFRFR